MQHNLQFSALLPSATHQDGLEETSSGDQWNSTGGGSSISASGCPYVKYYYLYK